MGLMEKMEEHFPQPRRELWPITRGGELCKKNGERLFQGHSRPAARKKTVFAWPFPAVNGRVVVIRTNKT